MTHPSSIKSLTPNIDASQSDALKLRRPVHFVCSDEQVWPELLGQDTPRLSPNEISRRTRENVDCWVIRLYYEMMVSGYAVTIGSCAKQNCINIFDVRSIGIRNRGLTTFTAVQRADAQPTKLANFLFRQIDHVPNGPESVFILIWIQPGIVARDSARPSMIRRLSFKGHPMNLDEEFRSQAFIDALSARGIILELADQAWDAGATNWSDFSETDAVIAVRNLTKVDAANKPGSKLVNAWYGETPALLGPEPAYQEMCSSELDYVEIHTAQDALNAIDRINASPSLFNEMVANGVSRRSLYSDKNLLERWISALNGPVAQCFDSWQKMPLSIRALYSMGNMLSEKKVKREYSHAIFNGPRILDAARAKMTSDQA